jgi:hypothetical protein
MGTNCACLTSKENENDLTLLNDNRSHFLCKLYHIKEKISFLKYSK